MEQSNVDINELVTILPMVTKMYDVNSAVLRQSNKFLDGANTIVRQE